MKRITTIAYEREEFGKNVVYNAEEWVSSSISPDGTKITGVVIARGGEMTNFVVINIENEEVLFEERRITYNHFNPSSKAFEWMSAQFSPDGTYIVAQLDYGHNGNSGPDSVYIYNAQTLEVYDVVLNRYINGNGSYNKIEFNSFENKISIIAIKKILLYNLDTKHIKELNFDNQVRNIVFSRIDTKMALQIGITAPVIFDYSSSKIIDVIPYIGLPQKSSLSNDLLYYGNGFVIALITPNWDVLNNVEEESIQINIFPNPTTGQINISINNQLASYFNYEIISDSGQIILSNELGFIESDSSEITISINSIPQGHYILRVFSEHEEFIFNIIKED